LKGTELHYVTIAKPYFDFHPKDALLLLELKALFFIFIATKKVCWRKKNPSA
jgi:hypothetical protein